MENMACEGIKKIIHEVESGSLAVFESRTKRYWAYNMDGLLRATLMYGGRRGIADAIDFANKNSGINYEIDDVLHELHLCERDSVRVLKTSLNLWVLYYCLFVERMKKAEKDRYYVSWKMLVSGWVTFHLSQWYERKDA